MIFKIFKKIFSSLGIGISLIFISLSLHSYFILHKVDPYFMVATILFSGVCLVIFLLLFFNKIKLIHNALEIKNYKLNILIGICAIIAAIVFMFSFKSPQLKNNTFFDIVGILFFGLGGFALVLKGIKQEK